MSRAIPFTADGVLVATAGGKLTGFVVEETAGAAAAVRLFDGADNTGVLLDTIRLVASTSEHHAHPNGIRFVTGLYADVVTGTVKAVAHIA